MIVGENYEKYGSYESSVITKTTSFCDYGEDGQVFVTTVSTSEGSATTVSPSDSPEIVVYTSDSPVISMKYMSEGQREKWRSPNGYSRYERGAAREVETIIWNIGYIGFPEHSIVVNGSGGGGVGGGERYPFARFFWSAVTYSLLPRGSCGEGVECAKDRMPLHLSEVVRNIVHKLDSRWDPVVGVEWFARDNEVACSVHLVCTFNLTHSNVSVEVLMETGNDVPRQLQERGYPTVGL